MEKINTLFYSIAQGCKNLKRNRMFTITSICTISACLFIFGIFFFLVSNVQYMVNRIEQSVAITVYFEQGITDSQKTQIALSVKGMDGVDNVEYVSADDAWTKFKSETFENRPELVETFGDDNPLQNSDSYQVYVSEISKQTQISNAISKMEGVRKVKSSKDVVKTLVVFNRLLSVVSIVLIGILVAVSLFLISNTISVGISVRKEEIGIMRMIGATDFFVQGPFVVEGVLIGIIGAVVPIVVLLFMYSRLVNWVSVKFSMLSTWLKFMSTSQEFSILIPACIAMGFGIGLLGSCFTVKKHLKV